MPNNEFMVVEWLKLLISHCILSASVGFVVYNLFSYESLARSFLSLFLLILLLLVFVKVESTRVACLYAVGREFCATAVTAYHKGYALVCSLHNNDKAEHVLIGIHLFEIILCGAIVMLSLPSRSSSLVALHLLALGNMFIAANRAAIELVDVDQPAKYFDTLCPQCIVSLCVLIEASQISAPAQVLSQCIRHICYALDDDEDYQHLMTEHHSPPSTTSSDLSNLQLSNIEAKDDPALLFDSSAMCFSGYEISRALRLGITSIDITSEIAHSLSIEECSSPHRYLSRAQLADMFNHSTGEVPCFLLPPSHPQHVPPHLVAIALLDVIRDAIAMDVPVSMTQID